MSVWFKFLRLAVGYNIPLNPPSKGDFSPFEGDKGDVSQRIKLLIKS